MNGRLVDSWRLAVGTLTAIRVRPPGNVDQRVARNALLLAPLAVLPLAATVMAIGSAGHWLGLPPLVVAVLAVGALAIGNRAMHWDGLSDTVDGFAASFDAERSLTVMRSGTSGPAGGVAVLVVGGTQAAALASLVGSYRGCLLVATLVLVSRCALALSCSRGVPAARTSGLGSTFAGTVPVAAVAALWMVAGVLLTVLVPYAGLAWWRGPVALVVAAGVVAELLRRARNRVGGITGDVLGAAVELALAALAVALS
jgi:adenosylcobinamide-GDP ribazoletransferase